MSDPGPTQSSRTPTERLTSLPIYVFSWLDQLKAAARARGAQLIDLGIGNPDRPTAAVVVEAAAAATADPRNHGYPPFRGIEAFRRAAARFMQRRFDVELDPEREILCLSGAKEGIAQITIGYTDGRSVSLVPDIYYPVHARATGLAGGRVHPMPIGPHNAYLPELESVPPEVLRDARILLLNYPHNPTGAVATLDFYRRAVEFCARHDIVLVSDLAYSELTYDGYAAPSVLQVPGAREVAIEFHSLSKSFNMAGWRVGFAAGDPRLIETLYAVRMNMGYGTPAFIQDAAALALDRAEELVPPVVAEYRRRRDVVVQGFRSLGWEMEPPRASMFAWLPIPPGTGAQEWTERLIDRAGVVVTPGNAFGPGGEGFFRVSLVAPPEVLEEAFERLRRAGIRYAG